MNAHERPIVTEGNKTALRAGETGNNVRYVLIGSVGWQCWPGFLSSIS
jgi:hypothetical protein